MILLVVGLAGRIVVVLIAVFLSIRLGHGDEHDERDLRSSGRDRRRDQDERWRTETPGGCLRPAAGGHPGYGSRGQARAANGAGTTTAHRGGPAKHPNPAVRPLLAPLSGRPRRPAAVMTPVPRSGPPLTTSLGRLPVHGLRPGREPRDR